MMRATDDAIVVGIGTAIEDDPHADSRLPGLANAFADAHRARPARRRLPVTSKLVQTAKRAVPVLVATLRETPMPVRSAELERGGAEFLATETFDGRVDPAGTAGGSCCHRACRACWSRRGRNGEHF